MFPGTRWRAAASRSGGYECCSVVMIMNASWRAGHARWRVGVAALYALALLSLGGIVRTIVDPEGAIALIGRLIPGWPWM
jgi:hypothetical protein